MRCASKLSTNGKNTQISTTTNWQGDNVLVPATHHRESEEIPPVMLHAQCRDIMVNIGIAHAGPIWLGFTLSAQANVGIFRKTTEILSRNVWYFDTYRVCAYMRRCSPEPSLIAYTKYVCRWRLRPKGVRALKGYFGPSRAQNWKLLFTNFFWLDNWSVKFRHLFKFYRCYGNTNGRQNRL